MNHQLKWLFKYEIDDIVMININMIEYIPMGIIVGYSNYDTHYLWMIDSSWFFQSIGHSKLTQKTDRIVVILLNNHFTRYFPKCSKFTSQLPSRAFHKLLIEPFSTQYHFGWWPAIYWVVIVLGRMNFLVGTSELLCLCLTYAKNKHKNLLNYSWK